VTPPPGDGPDEVLPKLTIGQRILAALPNLQREARPRATTPSRARASAPPAAKSPRRAGDGDGEAKDTGTDVVQPDAVLDPDTRTVGNRGTRAGATRSRGAAAANSAYASMSIPELRHAMKYLDDRERGLPMLVGPLLAALDLVLTVVALHNNPPLHHKNHADPASIVIVGIGSAVIAGLVLVSALVRRRSFTIFALLFSGYGGGLITLLPAWVLAGWLFIRFNRIQKTLVAKQGGPAAARQAAAKARGDRTAPRGFKRREAKESPEPAGPSASKRYTPPKPGRN